MSELIVNEPTPLDTLTMRAPGVEADDLLSAVAGLSAPAHNGQTTHTRRMVALLVDGLRYRAGQAG